MADNNESVLDTAVRNRNLKSDTIMFLAENKESGNLLKAFELYLKTSFGKVRIDLIKTFVDLGAEFSKLPHHPILLITDKGII